MEQEDMHHKHIHVENISAENQVFLLQLIVKYLNELYRWLENKRFYDVQTKLYHICDLPLKNPVDKISLWDYTMFWSGVKILLKQVDFPMVFCPYSEKDFQIMTENIDANLEWCEFNFQNNKTHFTLLQSRLNYLNFMIESLKQEIEASARTELLLSPDIMETQEVFPIYYFYNDSPKEEIISLKNKTVISYPWSKERMAEAIDNIAANGYDDKRKDVDGYYYPELEMVIVYNGRHYTGANIQEFSEAATANVQTYRIYDIIDKVVIEDGYWVNQTDKSKCIEICDMRYALLYYLLQKRFNLVKR
jgi:hypothetical protein